MIPGTIESQDMLMIHVLNDKSLVLVIDHLWERGGDGMMGSGRLCNKAKVVFHAWMDMSLFYCPLTHIAEDFSVTRRFGSVTCNPSIGPSISELLQERGLDVCWLSLECDRTKKDLLVFYSVYAPRQDTSIWGQ